ncbi:hypothetical protein B0T16DRAFT_188340 [Cercophora newfieldiana]|uniref:Uncharacterized protein n=1 Tax=Cercophora newfieldiana TaxID=92897 RepID=A0AA39Y0H7_9PEZI|nr:hypothetical protein B0T16DRAFT_188340 [Cercophora newfieldiana]
MPVPALLLTCKRIFTELSPSVFSTATLALRETWRGRRSRHVTLFAFGKFDPPRIHSFTLIVDAINTFHIDFIEKLTSYEKREEGFETAMAPKYMSAVPAMTQLREFTVVWFKNGVPHQSPGMNGPGRRRHFGTFLLGHLVTLKTLEVIRLRRCPEWWVEYLEEHSTARVICEEEDQGIDVSPGSRRGHVPVPPGFASGIPGGLPPLVGPRQGNISDDA